MVKRVCQICSLVGLRGEFEFGPILHPVSDWLQAGEEEKTRESASSLILHVSLPEPGVLGFQCRNTLIETLDLSS